MKLLLTYLLFVLVLTKTSAQIGFEKEYYAERGGQHIVQTFDGGYMSIGGTNNSNVRMLTLTKYNILGDTLWQKGYGTNINNGNFAEDGYWVEQTTDTGYIAIGNTKSFGAGWWDIYLVKTNKNGDTLWTKTYGSPQDEFGRSVLQTPDGGYMLVGSTQYPDYSHDLFLIKTDANGDSLWTKRYDLTSEDKGIALKPTNDNGYIITGLVATNGSNLAALKIDSVGNQLWFKNYGSSQYEIGMDVAEFPNGDFLFVGSTALGWNLGSDADIYAIRTDMNGDTIWTKTYGGNDREVGNALAINPDGTAMLLGTTASYGAGSWDMYLLKIDANGDTLWTKTYGNSDQQDGFSMQRTTDGGYVLLGSYQRLYIVKTDSLGNTTPMTTSTWQLPKPSSSIRIYPNPTKNKLFIETANTIDKLTIYNSMGKLVRQQTPKHREAIDLTDFEQGVYFIQLDYTDHKSEVHKFIISK